MRWSSNQVASHMAFVASRALWLDRQLTEDGPHRGRQRELDAMQWVFAQLEALYPEHVPDAWSLAHEHEEFSKRRRAEWSKTEGR